MPVISPRSPIGAANPHIYLRWFQPPDGASYTDGPSTSYTYDLGDRLTQVVDSISGTINLTHDGLDRLTQETTPQGTVSYTYDAASRRTSMTVAGQPPVTYGYDNANRLSSVTQSGSTVSMGYDGADRRTSLRLPTVPSAVTVNYTYDAADQLTAMIYKLGTTLLGDLTYDYDMNGNRSSMGGSFARTALPQALDFASYDAANRITQWGNLTVAYNYDFNGNLTGDLTNTYVWDARNRLVSMTGASFQYDAFGRRISKTAGGATTSFLYDDVSPVQELSGGAPTANLLAGLDVDEVFTRTDADGTRTILADGLGSTLALLDSVGAIQTQYTYEPFGKVTTSGLTSSNSFQYTGRENDGTGLHYYRARYYSPALHRFISEDPLGISEGTNPVTYVGNNPLSYYDPWGLMRWTFRIDGWQDRRSFGFLNNRTRIILPPSINVDCLCAASGEYMAKITVIFEGDMRWDSPSGLKHELAHLAIIKKYLNGRTSYYENTYERLYATRQRCFDVVKGVERDLQQDWRTADQLTRAHDDFFQRNVLERILGRR